jgi:hypothetical protein
MEKYNIVLAYNIPFKKEIADYTNADGYQAIMKKSSSSANMMIDEIWKGLLLYSKHVTGNIESGIIDKTLVVISPGSLVPGDIPEGVEVFEIDYSDIDTGLEMIDALGDMGKTLFVSGDCMSVKASDIFTFLRDSENYTTDLNVPFVPKEDFRKKFPSLKKYFFKLTEGRFAAGRMFTIKNDLLKSCALTAAKFVELADDPLEMAKQMGAKLSMKYTFGRLCIADIEAFADKKLGVNTKLVTTDAPGLCLGVNSVERLIRA